MARSLSCAGMNSSGWPRSRFPQISVSTRQCSPSSCCVPVPLDRGMSGAESLDITTQVYARFRHKRRLREAQKKGRRSVFKGGGYGSPPDKMLSQRSFAIAPPQNRERLEHYVGARPQEIIPLARPGIDSGRGLVRVEARAGQHTIRDAQVVRDEVPERV